MSKHIVESAEITNRLWLAIARINSLALEMLSNEELSAGESSEIEGLIILSKDFAIEHDVKIISDLSKTLATKFNQN